MAHTGGATEDTTEGSGCSMKLRSASVGLRSGSCSGERLEQLRAVKSTLLERLGPHERILTYLQSVLLWERPFHSVLLYTAANVMFWWVDELYLHGFISTRALFTTRCFQLKRLHYSWTFWGSCISLSCFYLDAYVSCLFQTFSPALFKISNRWSDWVSFSLWVPIFRQWL